VHRTFACAYTRAFLCIRHTHVCMMEHRCMPSALHSAAFATHPIACQSRANVYRAACIRCAHVCMMEHRCMPSALQSAAFATHPIACQSRANVYRAACIRHAHVCMMEHRCMPSALQFSCPLLSSLWPPVRQLSALHMMQQPRSGHGVWVWVCRDFSRATLKYCTICSVYFWRAGMGRRGCGVSVMLCCCVLFVL